MTMRFVNADGLVQTGQGLIGANMFSYCGNQPIMFIDPNGTCPIGFIGPCPGIGRCKYFSSVSSLNNSPSLLNTVPPSLGFEIPPSNGLISAFSDPILGGTEYALSHQTKYITAYIQEDNVIHLLPGKGIEVPRFPKTTNLLNKTSTVITAATLGWDLGNTWTANNSNTVGQRCIKSATIVGGTVAGIGVGYCAAAAANMWNPVGWGMVAGAVTFGAVVLFGNWAISTAQNGIYDYFDIK